MKINVRIRVEYLDIDNNKPCVLFCDRLLRKVNKVGNKEFVLLKCEGCYSEAIAEIMSSNILYISPQIDHI